MVKAIIEIPENENRVLTILKSKYGFRNKEQVIISLIKNAEENLEPKIRPEYLKKIEKIKRGKFQRFNNKEDFISFVKNEI